VIKLYICKEEIKEEERTIRHEKGTDKKITDHEKPLADKAVTDDHQKQKSSNLIQGMYIFLKQFENKQKPNNTYLHI